MALHCISPQDPFKPVQQAPADSFIGSHMTELGLWSDEARHTGGKPVVRLHQAVISSFIAAASTENATRSRLKAACSLRQLHQPSNSDGWQQAGGICLSFMS